MQSSPVTSSPLRFISDMIQPESAESRAHPDKSRDVWELALWDPLPVCLRLLCLFSPGHVLVYLIFLPLAPLDPRPSVTVFNTVIMQVVLSVQMVLLSSRYSQQAKDSAIIQKEVFHEYDTNFVQPRLHPVVRDVGTQMSENQPANMQEFVQVGTPTTLVRRSFMTHLNPHVKPEEPEEPRQQRSFTAGSNIMSPRLFTPTGDNRRASLFTPAVSSHRTSPSRQSLPAGYTPPSQTPGIPASATSIGIPTGMRSSYGVGFGARSKSPLKKAISMGDIASPEAASSPQGARTFGNYERTANEPPSSPTKFENRRQTGANILSSPHPFANMGKHQSSERFPKLSGSSRNRQWQP